MGTKLNGDWGKIDAFFTSNLSGIRGKAEDAMMQQGMLLAGDIRQGIKSQAPGGRPFVPLKDSTLEARKRRRKSGKAGTLALIDTGQLFRSIVARKLLLRRNFAVAVGVGRNAKNSDGESLVSIGMVHEYGAVINANKDNKQMAMDLGFKIGSNAKAFKIPARPFMRPTWEKNVKKIMQAIKKQVFGD